jgi:SAM-dependent methyltransferase
MKPIKYYARKWFSRLPVFVKERVLTFASARGLLKNPEVASRKEKLLRAIVPLSQDGLEIGALCNPIVLKNESNGRVFYVDFATAQQSREKYKDDPNVDLARIVETDYVWGKQTLPELVNGRMFDYVIASHVIEHVPNMLGWLLEIASVLKDGGVLSLAIPDKRYTFDFKRDLTSFGTLVEAYLLDKRRPGIRDIFDQVSLATKVDLFEAWSGKLDPKELVHHGSIQEALKKSEEYLTSDDYNDVHVNIMTPNSFLTIMEEASQLGLLDFRVLDFSDTEYNSLEFMVSLQRLSRNTDPEEKRASQLESISSARKKIAI